MHPGADRSGAIDDGRRTPPEATEAPTSDGDLREAPDFSLPAFSGGTFKLSDHAGKLPVVLNFWAPW